jgi:hypothetical protein
MRNRLKGMTKQRMAGRQPPSINDIEINKVTSHFLFWRCTAQAPGRVPHSASAGSQITQSTWQCRGGFGGGESATAAAGGDVIRFIAHA